MRRPSTPLMALRTVATLEISAIVAQAGWAAAWLGGDDRYQRYHAMGALLTVFLVAAGACIYIVLRRHAGPVNTILAILLAAAVCAQYFLGESGVTALHIFSGVLIAMLVTALTSWTYRQQDYAKPVEPGTH